MKIAVIFILVCYVVIAVHCQEEEDAWVFEKILRKSTEPPQTNPAPDLPLAPVPVAPGEPAAPTATEVFGNGQLLGCPCLTTHENNQVCGTDGNTYGNMGKLRCAQRCKDVQLAHMGSCSRKPN